MYQICLKKAEDTKRVIGSRKSKMNRHRKTNRKGRKRHTMTYKTLHRKLQIEKHEHHKKLLNKGASEGEIVPAPLVASVVLLLNDTSIMRYGNRVGQQHA
jgi:hypothetical protein